MKGILDFGNFYFNALLFFFKHNTVNECISKILDTLILEYKF